MEALKRGKSVLLLGARQTGKTTLSRTLDADLSISLARLKDRNRYEKDPSILSGEIEALREAKGRPVLVFIDEVQKVTELLDDVQDLIDRNVAQFVLTGSSARKLRRPPINLLPGRVVVMRMDPLVIGEIPKAKLVLEDLLLYGALPGVVKEQAHTAKNTDLRSYVSTYLEEEIRAEAVVRSVGSFSRFLELAAIESGNVVNLSKISKDVGVAHTTIAAYYSILEDCLVAERIEPLTRSVSRKRLSKSPRYLMFDLGIRRICANEGTKLSKEQMGRIFEQFVGLELVRNSRLCEKANRVLYWRDPDGPEVDWILETDGELIPIEVKWTDSPTSGDIRHLELFLREYSEARKGFVVCRVPRRIKMSENVTAIPWQEIDAI